MNWNRKLTELEMRALCNFVLDKDNRCTVVANKYDPKYKDEGLDQTLYKYERSDEYVFIVRQKGYIMNAVHIEGNEIDDFLTCWKDKKLTPYGQLKEGAMTK